MPSMYNGTALFDSGPHRFMVQRQGQTEVEPGEPAIQGQASARWLQLGLVQLSITVRGRLIAPDEAGLWALRDAISAELTASASPATLEDGNGRIWTGMWLVRYEETGPVDIGRAWSIGYKAVFRKVGQ
ncbi:MAG: hypothetical protein AAFV77_07555 [Planctomycetota bacterium]|nr:hypothetical protein [Phycisphaerales bacterium]